MRRVRRNVEIVTDRLRALDYDFTQPTDAFVPPPDDVAAQLDALDAELGPLPVSLRAFYETEGSVCGMGSHPELSVYHRPPDLKEMLGSVGGLFREHFGELPPAPPPAPPKGVDPAAFQRLTAAPGMAEMLGQASQLIRALTQRALDVPD